MYYIISPSLFPSFPFILFHPYFSVFTNNFFSFSSKLPCIPIFPLASKIMLDDIYRKRDSMQLVGGR